MHLGIWVCFIQRVSLIIITHLYNEFARSHVPTCKRFAAPKCHTLESQDNHPVYRNTSLSPCCTLRNRNTTLLHWVGKQIILYLSCGVVSLLTDAMPC